MTDADLIARVTPKLLCEISGSPASDLIVDIAGSLVGHLPASQINTPLRLAHFLAQCCEESWRFTKMTESLIYSAASIRATFSFLSARADQLAHNPQALANAAYAGKWGNGDEASGDGFRFRGRALLQHTFRDNYSELQSALDLPLLTDPDLLCQPDNAVRAAIYWFTQRGCIPFADKDDVAGVTLKINGGRNGIIDRGFFARKALSLLTA